VQRDTDVAVFEPYARVAYRLAAKEVATVTSGGSRAEAVEGAVVGTVVFEAAWSRSGASPWNILPRCGSAQGETRIR
jgi:hypothetical protein